MEKFKYAVIVLLGSIFALVTIMVTINIFSREGIRLPIPLPSTTSITPLQDYEGVPHIDMYTRYGEHIPYPYIEIAEIRIVDFSDTRAIERLKYWARQMHADALIISDNEGLFLSHRKAVAIRYLMGQDLRDM